ncbi:MAG: 4Fe-4S binding protein [Oscillospiraceae bacterium]
MALPFIREAITQLFSKPSTERYPYVDKIAPEDYRGRIVFHADKCIDCNMCQRVCAGSAITRVEEETPEGKLITRSFFLGSCTFCATCADFCSTHAIELSKDYHMVARCEDDLIVKGSYIKKPPVKKAPPPVTDAAPKAAPEKQEDGKPVNDTSKCIYCGICAKNCPGEAITVDRPSKTWTLNAELCIGCGTCAEKCPKKCITI